MLYYHYYYLFSKLTAPSLQYASVDLLVCTFWLKGIRYYIIIFELKTAKSLKWWKFIIILLFSWHHKRKLSTKVFQLVRYIFKWLRTKVLCCFAVTTSFSEYLCSMYLWRLSGDMESILFSFLIWLCSFLSPYLDISL